MARLREQASSCAQLGSPLYEGLLARAAEDVAGGGPTWRVVEGVAGEPDGSAWPLRLMAAVHRLVLERRAPALALHYPSAGGTAGDLAGAWAAFRGLLGERPDEVRALLRLPCQTNEVGRSAALVCGLLWFAERAGLPLRLLEVGASAGLNLRMDRFRYGGGGAAWGPPSSPCRLPRHWVDPPPLGAVRVEVVERRGCDPQPVDPATAEGRLTLTCSVWPDQGDRLERLRGAMALAAEVPATVDAAGLGAWLPQRLAEGEDGIATLVYHSVVWRYVPPDQHGAFHAAIRGTGARATASRPLAWLRLEPVPPEMHYDGTPYPLTITTWPGGEERVLATALAHGQQVRWCAGP